MADLWFTAKQLGDAVGAKQAESQPKLDLAARVASKETRRLCGPVSPVETVSERVRVRVPCDGVPLKYRPTSLTSIVDYRSGTALTVTEYDTDGQVLFRKDGGLICDSLTVTYAAGYAADAIPDELVAMASLIGQQYLRVSKRFSLSQDDPVTGIGFLVPDAAKDVARDYLLAPEGIG